jgi:hypothetical protein
VSAQLRTTHARLQPSQRTIELRRQVERLEFARRDALACGDSVEGDLIDKQIAQAGADWAASFAADRAESYRKTA